MSVFRQQSIDVFVDYNQFYIQDGGVNPPAPERWDDEDISNRSKVAENVVVVCPLRNMTVPVEVAVYDSEPASPEVNPDHLVECSVSLPTGQLQVHECTGASRLNWQVASGTYRVRLSYFGLGTISSDGLEGSDFYKIELWPGKHRDLRVKRLWPL